MSARRIQILVISTLGLTATAASAMPIETGSDFRLSWDNTALLTLVDQPGTTWYGAAGRCVPGGEYPLPTDLYTCAPRSGLTSARLDWLSRVIMSYQDVGAQISSAAWYDPAYESWKKQGRPAGAGAATNQYFTASSTEPDGDIELFDAFVYGTTSLGTDQPLSFRIGRQVSLWGESLYFVDNGIAAGQAPIDTYRYQTGGYDQANQSFLPVGQASFSWQPMSGLAVIGYYQFEWRRSRISPYDAYDSTATMLGSQYTQQIVLPIPGGQPVAYDRTSDRYPGSTDQFGLGLRGHQGDFDWGLYGLSFNAKTPELYFYPPGRPYPPGIGSYALVYPKGIETYGASLTGPLGDASFGAEISARRNMPLVNAGILLQPPAGFSADNDDHPRYPVGDTLHAQFSWIYTTPPLPGIPGGASWSGEVAANDLLATTANADQLIPGRTRAAAALRTIFEPQFFQIWPRFDLTLPVGFGYNFLGLSEVDPSMNRGTADLTLGATLTFDQSWKFGLSATHYFGETGDTELPFNQPGIKRPLSDGDFLALSVARSF
jgi:Protein of unknown function (DUF1302)